MPEDLAQLFSRYGIPTSTNNDSERKTQLLVIKDRFLYLWTKDGLRVAVGLKYASSGQNVTERKCTFEFEVKLCLTINPNGKVEWLEINRSGNCLAICSDRRVHVVFLPRTLWLLRSFNEIEKEYLCKCVSVDNEIWKRNKEMKCLRVKWHPGSPTDRHLVTLWSDNVIRIYSIGDKSEPPTQVRLLNQRASDAPSSKNEANLASHGETAVSFDFGSSLDAEDPDEELWPIFVLCSDGTVFSVLSDIKANRHFVSDGPLAISPTGNTTYGAGSCDIVFLPGKVSLLIIATVYGVLYHALVFRDEQTNPSFRMHIYESVELEFALSTVDLASAEIKEDNEASNIVLIKDPLITRRYFAVHRAGFHQVELPWAQDLEEETGSVLSDTPANVEYVLCTTPIRTDSRFDDYPLGLAVLNSFSTESVVLALLSDFSICYFPAKYGAVSSLSSSDSHETNVHKKTTNRDYFIDTMKRTLQKTVTVPTMKTTIDICKKVNEQEAAEVIHFCLDKFRKEYVQHIFDAREACQKHVAEQATIFAQQKQDLVRIQSKYDSLKQRALTSKQRRDKLTEDQQALTERLEKVAEMVDYGGTGELSVHEESMSEELNGIRKNVDCILEDLAELTGKVDSVTEEMRGQSGFATPTRNQEVSVKQRLEEHQRQIESLLHTVKNLKREIR